MSYFCTAIVCGAPVSSTVFSEARRLLTPSACGSSGLSGKTSKSPRPTISSRRVSVASRYAPVTPTMRNSRSSTSMGTGACSNSARRSGSSNAPPIDRRPEGNVPQAGETSMGDWSSREHLEAAGGEARDREVRARAGQRDGRAGEAVQELEIAGVVLDRERDAADDAAVQHDRARGGCEHVRAADVVDQPAATCGADAHDVHARVLKEAHDLCAQGGGIAGGDGAGEARVAPDERDDVAHVRPADLAV